jgi:hypothetical protein
MALAVANKSRPTDQTTYQSRSVDRSFGTTLVHVDESSVNELPGIIGIVKSSSGLKFPPPSGPKTEERSQSVTASVTEK